MKRLSRIIAIAALGSMTLVSCDPAVLEGIMSGTATTAVPLSNEEVIRGLKEALSIGAQNAVSFTSKENGFLNNPIIRIPFPEEAQKVKNAALNLGLSAQVERFESTLNKAAEKAAAEAVPVFVNAITSMSIQDGFNILRGDSTAATQFLKKATTAELTQKFTPIVQKAIDEVKLTSYWEPLTKAYNQSTLFTGNQPVNTDLTAYVTEKALSGLFYYVADEEKKIRKDPAARVTDLLKRVFGSNQ
ncbi:MAG TPA: DUF4197 domain-containing protein [Flavobacteriales bacterium]